MTRRAALAAAGCLLLAAASVRAQERPAPSFTGSVRAGYWSSTRNLDRDHPFGAGMMWLKGTIPLPRGITAFAEGWSALRGPPDDADATMELREAFVTASVGGFDLRLGRQIVAWGRADGVNPTGSLAAEDLTLLTPEDADRRRGAATAVVSGYLGEVAVSGLWIPEFRGHRFPLPPAPGTAYIEARPDWPGDQWALRAERTGGAVDWSVSVFRGYDLTPDLAPAGTGRIALRHHRVSLIGADLATTAGRYGLRAEAAYTRTEDGVGTDPFTKNPFVFVVIGGDRTFDGRINLNVQYLVRGVLRFRSPPGHLSEDDTQIARHQAVLSAETRRVQHGASMRGSVKWLRETLETEWAAVAYLGPRGIAMRPKVTYTATDQITLSLGAEVFRGEDGSLFRLLRSNSVAYVEGRWGF